MPDAKLSARRQRRGDGQLGAAVVRPWAKWDVLSRADSVATVIVAAATALCAGAIFGTHVRGEPWGFGGIAPLVGAILFVGLVAMFLERERHGVARTFFAAGGLLLAIAACFYSGRVPIQRVVAFYWAPAVLSMGAAAWLTRGRRQASRV